MTYGQPFYNYGANGAYSGQGAVYAPQQAQYGNFYAPQQQVPQNANNGVIPQYPQQPMQMQQQQATQFNIPIKDIRFVTSEEAKAFIVMPNSNALLIDMAGGMAYFKTADALGQSVTKSYKFSEIAPDGTIPKPVEEKPAVNFDEFVKRQEIADYIQQYGFVTKEQYKTLQSQLDNLKREIANSNNNGGNGGNGRKQQQG